MTYTRLAVIDRGEANERILSKEGYRTDFKKVEGASLKRKTHLCSPEAKRMFARCFYSFQASMYFVSHLGRTKLDHAVVEKIEEDVRAALEAGTKELNDAIDQAEALLKSSQIETLASYDTVPMVEEIGITSSFGRRYFDLIHKLDMIMPLMETLVIEEVISEREHELRRSRFKRVVLSICTKARNFWTGARRRMNEPEPRIVTDGAGDAGSANAESSVGLQGDRGQDHGTADAKGVEPEESPPVGASTAPAVERAGRAAAAVA